MQAHRLAALSAIVLYAWAAGPLLRDVDGRPVTPISDGISVLLFTRSDCSISNRYAPTLARLHQRFHRSGVQFHLVYVDGTQSTDAARVHLREFRYPFRAVIDAKHDWVRLSGVTTTPEAAVYASGRLVYRGRIDNKYVSAGLSRPTATVHDLEQTIAKALEGQPLQFRTEPAVGCFIEDVR